MSISFLEVLSADQVDEVLLRLESGVDIAFGRAKVWSKYAKEIITFVQKRIELGIVAITILNHLVQQTSSTCAISAYSYKITFEFVTSVFLPRHPQFQNFVICNLD